MKTLSGSAIVLLLGGLATAAGQQPRVGKTAAAPATPAKAESRVADAAKRRDDAAVRALVGQRVDVNAPQLDGATALHWAAHWNNLELTGVLIDAGAQVNAQNDYGVSPISLAATNGNLAIVDRLLRARADANAADKNGSTPLMFAARAGSVDVVKALLAGGVEVDFKNVSHGQTALMWAASAGHTPVVRALIASGADVNAGSKNGYTALMLAARENGRETIQTLLDNKADLNLVAKDGSTALVLATVLGYWPLSHYLMEQGANVNADGAGFTALHWAAGIWETQLTTTLGGGTRGYDIYAGRGPGKLELVNALLARGSNPNALVKVMPPTLGFRGSLRMSIVGATPLMLAAKGADLEIMRVLLAAGADPKINASDKTTTLTAAAGYAYVIGAELHPQEQALEAVRLLLDLGVDPNAANEVGETALHAAAYTGWEHVSQLLLDRGAQVDARNVVGWTPLAIAQGFFDTTTMTKTVHPHVIAVLKKYGAQPTPPSHEQKRLRY